MISATCSADRGSAADERAQPRRGGRRPAERGHLRRRRAARSPSQAAARAEPRRRGRSSSIAAALSLWATGLAIRRAVQTDDLLADDEVVLAQRRAGRGEVDDRLDDPGQRRELDRALDLDDLGLAPGLLEVAGGDLRVLGRDAHHAEPAQRLGRGVRAGLAWPGPSCSGRSRGRAARRPRGRPRRGRCGRPAPAARPCR